MLDTLLLSNNEFFRPLVAGWVAKIDAAMRGRSKWKEQAEECSMFYSKSAAAMWDPAYSRKFWRGVKAPKFRLSINKAFEMVAVFGPNLFWETPQRTVTPKRAIEIPPELFAGSPEMEQMYQALSGEIQQDAARDKLTAHLMQTWLNYTTREQPGNGLYGHSFLALTDALVTGRGCLFVRPYQFPSSGRTITGAFRESPYNVLLDPDFTEVHNCKWMALKHCEPHWAVERRFDLPFGSLRNRTSLESSWQTSELRSFDDGGNPHKAAGKTGDFVVWYEIWSKAGVGSRKTAVPDILKDHLEETVGDYAYLAICPDCPFPLNCPAEALRGGASDDEVRQRFSWPIPFWTDDRWPCEFLDFYTSTDSAWPIPPLAPAMGELKFLNFLIPWLCNRIYSSSRDFLAVLGPHLEHYKKYLEEGEDLTVLPIAPGAPQDDIKKAIQVLQLPEARADLWKIVELVSHMFDLRTGLTPTAYGQNEDGTQNRSAEETMAKQRAVGVRPEHMQKRVVAWQSDIAALEGFLARWCVEGDSVEPLMGRGGRLLWEQYVMSTDVELVARQMQFEIAAASIRRPNRDRDIGNFQEFSARVLPVIQAQGMATGDFTAVNGFIKKWGELHDMDTDGFLLPGPDPQSQEMQQAQSQLQMQQMQAETEKTQAEAAKANADAQANPVHLKIAELQLDQEAQQQQLQLDMQKSQAELANDLMRLRAEMALKTQQAALDMKLQASQGALDLHQKASAGRLDFALKAKQGEQKLQQDKQQSAAKVQAIKSQAKAKPKPTNGKAVAR